MYVDLEVILTVTTSKSVTARRIPRGFETASARDCPTKGKRPTLQLAAVKTITVPLPAAPEVEHVCDKGPQDAPVCRNSPVLLHSL